MPRSFFSRVLTQNILVLLVFLLLGGLLLDSFLSESEVRRLGDQVSRFAAILKEDVAKCRSREELQPLLRRLEASTHIRFTVIDKSGGVLADSLLDPATMENHASHPEVAQALGGKEGRNLRKSQSVGIEMLYVALPGDPVIRAAMPISEVNSIIGEVQLRIVLASLPALLFALILAYLLAKSLNARIERMRRFSTSLEKGEYDVVLKAEGDDELSDMERSLSALRDEIKSKVDNLEHDARILSGLVEGFPHAVLLFDGKPTLTLANSLARRLLRLDNTSSLGLPAGEIIRNPKILEAIDAGLRTKSFADPFRLVWTDPSGHYEVLVSPLVENNPGGGFILILRDVTKEVYLEKVRSDFIVNLSHELRTPLTAIRGSAETLLTNPAEHPPVVVRFLETIKRNSLRLESLLADVSDLARAENAVEEIEIKVFDAGAPLRNAADLFKGEALKAGIALVVTTPETPLDLSSDEGRIEQILINLIQNAIRYTPQGGRVSLTLDKRGEKIVYTVTDTGIGIPASDIPRVTERFYRVDPGRSRAVGGTGLGLSIVKHLVERLKGDLTIKSTVGQGTVVEVALPINQSHSR